MGLIDADRLKEEIVEAGQRSTRYRIGEFWELNRNEIWKVIDEQPSLRAERKQGEWINEGRIIRCSKCKIGYAVVKGMKSAITYNFCPNCGADMRPKEGDA